MRLLREQCRIKKGNSYMKPDLSFAILDRISYQVSDNAAADALQQARRQLFNTLHEQERRRA